MNPLDAFQKFSGKSPEEARFFWTGGPIAIAARTVFASYFSGVTAFETDDGIVLVDSGLAQMSPLLASLIRQNVKGPIHSAVYTQGHVDHAYGLAAFLSPEQEAPKVYGHRQMMERFARYEKTAPHNASINARQFGGAASLAEGASAASFDVFRTPTHPPTHLFDQEVELSVGGITFEVHHCRGETDDHAWVYCREREVLCPGDLFIWACPNAGNPQKVQRYPWDWAAGLRRMAAENPRSMCPGHGAPVVDDPELIQRMLLETAEFLEDIVESTLRALNDGSPPHVDIVHTVTIPKRDQPWLADVYDDAEFIIRNVVRYYGGWWTGRPSELKPATRTGLAEEIVALAGGTAPLLDRADALMQIGADEERRRARGLADYALEAAVGDQVVQERVARLYDACAEKESSLMARNLFRSAAAYAREGRQFR